MSKQTYYHGTTYSNYLHMREHGLDTDKQATWTCSDDNFLYLWDQQKFIDVGEIDDESEADRVISQAFENASITAALRGSLDPRLIVIELELDSDDVQDDNSCDNMASLASCVPLSQVTFDNVKHVYLSEDYNPHLRPFYLAGLLGNEWFPDYELDYSMIEACKAVREVFIDSIIEFGWREI